MKVIGQNVLSVADGILQRCEQLRWLVDAIFPRANLGEAILGTRVGSPLTRLLDHIRKMVNRILPKNKGRWMISVVECRRQNDFGAELEYFSFNGDPSSDSRACGRKLMVESGSFLSLESLNGLSGRYCNISFMVDIMIEKHSKY